VSIVDRIEILQGTLDLIVLRALATMGPQHAYGLAAPARSTGKPTGASVRRAREQAPAEQAMSRTP
jgi:hypothetical protein